MTRRIILSLAALAAAAVTAAGSGHAARTPGIHVQPIDLAVTSISTVPAAQPRAGDKLLHLISVVNAGSGRAHSVRLLVSLRTDAAQPFDVLDAWALNVAGRWLHRCPAASLPGGGSATVTCELDDLAAGASARVGIVTRPLSPGKLGAGAFVRGNGIDRNRGNNGMTSVTVVV